MLLSELVYTRKGTGEPLVLLHGIGHRRQAWNPVFDKLAEKYDVIAVDLSGFGESAAYEKGVAYTMDNACQDLAANFERWGVTRPHAVGNSLGGAISLELAARGLVSSATALSPAGFFGRISRFQALIALTALRLIAVLSPDVVLKAVSRSTLGRKLIGAALYSHPERSTAEDTYGDAVALKKASAFERTAKSGITYAFAGRIDVPTTIAWGTKDRILPYSQSARASELLPNVRHVPIPGAGHVPMIDDPELIIRLIDQTVAETQDAASPGLRETA